METEDKEPGLMDAETIVEDSGISKETIIAIEKLSHESLLEAAINRKRALRAKGDPDAIECKPLMHRTRGQVVEYLRAKGLDLPPNCEEAVLSILINAEMGHGLWDGGHAEEMAKLDADYRKVKDRPSVKRMVEIGGLNEEPWEHTRAFIGDYLIIEDQMTDSVYEGITHKADTLLEAYSKVVYSDGPSSCCAFVGKVEDLNNVEIKDYKQLLKLAGMDSESPEDNKEAEETFILAMEHRLASHVAKIIREGGKWKDLMAIDLKDFNLTDSWRISGEEPKTLIGIIRFEIGSAFKLRIGAMEGLMEKRVTIGDVADSLDAPYGEIMKASTYFQDVSEKTEEEKAAMHKEWDEKWERGELGNLGENIDKWIEDEKKAGKELS